MDKMKEETRILIAFLLSILIILIFSKFQSPRYHPSSVSEVQKTEIPQPEIPAGEKFELENNLYLVKFDLKGTYIEKIGLKKFLKRDEKVFLLNENSIFFLDSFSPSEFKKEIEGNSIKFSSSGDLEFSKKFNIPSDDFIFYYSETIKNNTKQTKKIENYYIDLIKINVSDLKSQRGYVPPQIIVGINKLPVFINPLRIKQEKIYKPSGWVGFLSRYSLIFIYLPEKSTVSVFNDSNWVNIRLILDDITLEPLQEQILNFKFYAGPSDYFIAREKIKENIFGKGIFVSIGRFLFVVLNGIHKIIPNWGWAIIILTIIIKILFFPLTRKSLRSMKQLQKLRPYLQDIQKKYKDNPHQLQKELMNIYREYDINPFAGCLPTLIQIPIFIGFFLALRNSIFLRGAPFILWIKDLSSPDTVAVIKGFSVNILPILMTITSYLQQKLTPSEPGQKSLTIILPLMFLFILYNFPSGLLLYWVTMNIASLIEQFFIKTK